VISVILHLGYGFLRATLGYPFRAGRGQRRFLAAYGPDGDVPVSREHRAASAGFERCIGCGLCELALPRPMALADLARSWCRSPETWPALGPLLDALGEADLKRAEAECPAGVPLETMVLELRRMQRVRDELGGRTRGDVESEHVKQAATASDDIATIGA
jgi:ferredoxin